MLLTVVEKCYHDDKVIRTRSHLPHPSWNGSKIEGAPKERLAITRLISKEFPMCERTGSAIRSITLVRPLVLNNRQVCVGWSVFMMCE